MASPFRNNKKTRKQMRRSVKDFVAAADKFDLEGLHSDIAASLRRTASSLIKIGQSKRKKRNAARKPAR